MAERSPRSTSRETARALPGWKVSRVASGKFGLLLIALVTLVLLSPLFMQEERRVPLLSLLTGAVLVAGLQAARPGRGTLALGLALALLDFGMGRLAMSLGTHWLLVCQALFWLTTLLYVIVTILEAIFSSPRITVATLQAALCVYLLIGMIGAFVLALIELTLPGSFEPARGVVLSWGVGHATAKSMIQLMSLSYAALSTVGLTQLSPATGFASNAISLLAMTGQIYLAVVVARLVGIASSGPAQSARETSP